MTKTRDDAWALPDELLNPYPEQEPGPQPEPDHFSNYCPEPEPAEETDGEGHEADE